MAQLLPQPVVERIAPSASLVALGAAAGTFLRASIGQAFPALEGTWPWTTFWINIAGSLVLGVLLGAIALKGDASGWTRIVRLCVGTGAIGGFTSYSAFILEIDQLVGVGEVSIAATYALVSVVMGIAASAAGLAAAASIIGGFSSEGREV